MMDKDLPEVISSMREMGEKVRKHSRGFFLFDVP